MNIIVAACKNRGIGINNTLPWKLKNEMKYFKEVTIGKGNNAVVMGKNTWLSLKRPLPKRDNFVLSSTLHSEDLPKNVKLVKDIKMINELYKGNFYDNIWILGGENLYRSMLYNDNINSIFYTQIYKYIKCDTVFPDIPSHFIHTYHSNMMFDSDENIEYTYNIYQNKNLKNSSNSICLYKEAMNKLEYHEYKKIIKKITNHSKGYQ